MATNVNWICTTEQKPWQTRTIKLKNASDGGANLEITGQSRQRWEGFGGCFNELGWIALSSLRDADRRRAMNTLFDPKDGCRFTICRLPIGASDYAAEWYSHNETPGDFAMKKFSIARDEKYLIPYIRAAQAIRPDLSFFASPWSPPTWMKFPHAYNYGTLIWTPENLNAYALYFVKFIQAYAKAGIPIAQVHPQNEPVADQKFPSCLWTGAQLRDFIRDYLSPALRKHKLDSEIWLGTLNTDDYDNYIHAVLADPKANEAIAGVGFQWAGKGAIQRTHASYPDKRLMQTENECGDGKNTWIYARFVFSLIQHYVANGANAYVYWNMVLADDEGRSTWGWRQNSMITVNAEKKQFRLNPEFYVMKHFAAVVEPGATVLELKGQWSGNAAAFENPDGSIAVVVQNSLSDSQMLQLRAPTGVIEIAMAAHSINTIVI